MRDEIDGPKEVVQRLVHATNAKDIDALVQCFADDHVNETTNHPARSFRSSGRFRPQRSERPSRAPVDGYPVIRVAGGTGRLGSFVVGALVVGLLVMATLGLSVPSARADTFCDLSPSADGVGIDFGRPLAEIRSSATARLPFFQKIAKFLPANAPKSVRSLYADDERIVAGAAKVTTAKRLDDLLGTISAWS